MGHHFILPIGIFYNIIKIMVFYIILACILSLILMPVIIKLCNKFQIYDFQSARKIHSGNISRLGGVGIFISFFISAFLYLVKSNQVDLKACLPILIAGFIIFTFGLVDDILNLPAILKLLIQLVAVSIVTFSGFRFTQIFAWKLPTIISFVLTFGWILGVINAYNLIDGLDGLCGSLSFTTMVTLGVLYSLSSNVEASLCFILAGAIFGFLCFNWPPAKLFMGDGGSQFLGFMIATIPLFSSSDIFEFNKFLIMIILTSIPVFDTIAAIWRRLRDKRPIMSADRSHLHHKLLNMGYSKTKTLYLLLFIQCLLCIIVISSFFLGTIKGSCLLSEALIFMVLFFSFIHYTNKSILIKQQKEKELNCVNAEENKSESEKSPDTDSKN